MEALGIGKREQKLGSDRTDTHGQPSTGLDLPMLAQRSAPHVSDLEDLKTI